MTFHEEVAQAMKEAGLTAFEFVEIPDEMKATPEDYAELQRKIDIRMRENDEMLAMSIKYARESKPCGD